jgi:hypothetical protein
MRMPSHSVLLVQGAAQKNYTKPQYERDPSATTGVRASQVEKHPAPAKSATLKQFIQDAKAREGTPTA